MPDKVAQMKEVFIVEATRNQALPIGGALWIPIFRPEWRVAPRQIEWTFPGDFVRMPEFTAPALGNRPNVITIDADIPAEANGVLYKLGAHSGGLTLFAEDGFLCCEYNLFIIQRTKVRATDRLPTGRVRMDVGTSYLVSMPWRGPPRAGR